HVDSHKDADIRRVLAPLSELAGKHRLAVVAVMHLKKSETSALLRVSGSIGFVAAARCVWGFGEDPVAVNTRVMVAVKNNLAAMGDGLGYRIEAFQSVPRIVWLKDPIDADANEILSGDKDRRCSSRGNRRSAAEVWVRDMDLTGRGKPVIEIKKAADKAEIAWRTVERAKEGLPIRSVQQDGQWWWVFEGDDPKRQN